MLSKREAYPRGFSPRTTGHRSPSRLSPTSSSSSEGTRTALSGSSSETTLSTFIMADEKTREALGRGSCAWISARPRSTKAKHRHCSKRRAARADRYSNFTTRKPLAGRRSCSSIALDKMRELASPLTVRSRHSSARDSTIARTQMSAFVSCGPAPARLAVRARAVPRCGAPRASVLARASLTDDASHVVAPRCGASRSRSPPSSRSPPPPRRSPASPSSGSSRSTLAANPSATSSRTPSRSPASK